MQLGISPVLEKVGQSKQLMVAGEERFCGSQRKARMTDLQAFPGEPLSVSARGVDGILSLSPDPEHGLLCFLENTNEVFPCCS